MRPIRRHMQVVFQDPYGSLDPRQKIARDFPQFLRTVGAAEGDGAFDLRPILPLQLVVDLPRALGHQEEAARDQDEVAPRDLVPHQDEERRGEPHDPGEAQQQQDAREHRQREPDGAGLRLLVLRQLPREDGDEDDVVDAEDELEGELKRRKSLQNERRTVRAFSPDPVPGQVLRDAIACAATALTSRSAPSSWGASIRIGIPVLTDEPTIRQSTPRYRLHICS